MIKRAQIKVTTTGSAGSATGSGRTAESVNGIIRRIDINYHGSCPATADLTMVQDNEQKATNIINLANQSTDKQVYPAVALTDSGGTALTYDATRPIYMPMAVDGELVASIAQADALTDCVVIDIYYEV